MFESFRGNNKKINEELIFKWNKVEYKELDVGVLKSDQLKLKKLSLNPNFGLNFRESIRNALTSFYISLSLISFYYPLFKLLKKIKNLC